jgi:hypothetical protein
VNSLAYDYHKEGDSKLMTYIRDHFSEIVMTISVVAFIFTAIYTLVNYRTENIRLTPEPLADFSENWTVNETQNQDSSYTLHFQKTLPADVDDHSAIVFESRDEVLFVYLDGELIFTFGIENNFARPINLGGHYVLINLPDGCDGKQIDIYATYKGKHTDWRTDRDFWLEGNDGIILKLVKSDLPSIAICFVMLLLGVFEFFKSIFLICRRQKGRVHLYLALFIFASSFYLLSDTVLMQLLFNSTYVKYIISYFSFLLLPCMFPMFAKERLTRFNLPLAFAACVSWAYAVISMALFIIRSIGFEKHLYVAHGLMAFVVITVLVCCFLDRKNKPQRNLIWGTIILGIFAIVSLIAYHQGYIKTFFSAYNCRFFYYLGIICFVIILLFDSYQHSANKLKAGGNIDTDPSTEVLI